MSIESAEFKKLRWRSRRGMQELDKLLNAYLDQYPEGLDPPAIKQFNTLLETEDDRLWLWLSGQQQCPNDYLTDLIDDIRATI